jgi:cyclopropane fatty-acyl-phospholipid synthase-like methyltransferase
MNSPQTPPYFDILFARLQASESIAERAFGRHVHWGYWDDPATADGTVEDFAAASEKLCHRVTDAASIASGQRLLDVGCGFGGTLASLNERFENLDLTGVNIDPRQLDRARQMIILRAGNKLRLLQADACALPFPGETFDAITAVECIFHFPSRKAFFTHVARLLKPGCRLALSDFVPDSARIDLLRSLGAGSDEATRTAYGHLDVCCTMEEYETLGNTVGLRLVHDHDCTPNVLPTYPFLRTSFQHGGESTIKDGPDARMARLYDQATAQLEWACRKGLITYRIFAFERTGTTAC